MKKRETELLWDIVEWYRTEGIKVCGCLWNIDFSLLFFGGL